MTRLYTGSDGESHFEDIDISLIDKGDSGKVLLQQSTNVMFWEMPPNSVFDWHPTPQRLYFISLDGEFEMEVGDGTKREFKPGDIVLCEDTSGRGHITRSLRNQSRKYLYITLDSSDALAKRWSRK